MTTSPRMPTQPPRPVRAPAAVFWAEGRLLGASALLAGSADAILGAALTGYSPSASYAERLACRRRLATAMAIQFQETEIRAAEGGGLGSPWTLVAQTQVVRRALTADRTAPLPVFVNLWPTSQPKLVLCARLTGGDRDPTGNVLVLDPSTTTSFLKSLSEAKIITWGRLQ